MKACRCGVGEIDRGGILCDIGMVITQQSFKNHGEAETVSG